MKQPEIPVVNGSQVEKLCKVAEVRRILISMKAALPEKQKGCVAVTTISRHFFRPTLKHKSTGNNFLHLLHVSIFFGPFFDF